MSCQASPICCPEMTALAPVLGYSGEPPSALDTAVEQLSDMFPQQARSFLLDIFEQAGCDLTRAVECLQVVLGMSRPASPAKQPPDDLRGTPEQLGLDTGGSSVTKQKSANRAMYQLLSHCGDSRTFSPARQGSGNLPTIAHPDLFPAEVKNNTAHTSFVEDNSARCRSWIHGQPGWRLNLLAQSHKWWPKYGAKNLPFVPKHADQHCHGCNAGDTASPPTKLLNSATTAEAYGVAASLFESDKQLSAHLADLKLQPTLRGGSTLLTATAASQVPQPSQARPSGNQTPEPSVLQCNPRQATVQSWSECDLSASGSASSASTDWPLDNAPKDAKQKQQYLQDMFNSLPPMMIANALRECQYDMSQASDKCIQFVGMANGVPEWSESSDADTSSVAADSLAEAQSPAHRMGCVPDWLDDAESLQEQDFEQKAAMLRHEFPQVNGDQVHHFLETAQGNSDVAYSMLLEDVDHLVQQEVARLRQEEEDRNFALQLQEQQSTSSTPAASNNPFASTLDAGRRPPPSQVDDWLVSRDLKMKPKLGALQAMFPDISMPVLQEQLAAADGHLPDAVKHLNAQLPADKRSTFDSWGSLSTSIRAVPAGRPITPPPGMPPLARVPHRVQHGHNSDGRTRRNQRVVHNDLYTEARHNFRDAQANMLVCKQKFHAAMQAGDKQEQQHYSRQLEYWQKKALDEKHRAHKKIFSKKNAEVSNTFKVDLHALHVDEALYEVERTIKALSPFKCTWIVEAVVGKGLHSVKDPKLLPAVKQYLKNLGVHFWEVPGMVVFNITPVDDSD